ncbi:MAG: FixH family protein [Saprospiraceae bacterium]|nr:FixH family protein [Saprospiraceae bacterium]
MRKYFNAGSFILLGGLLFIIFIFILMIDFAKRDSSLVAENYYQREINYSAHQKAVTNFDSIDSLVEFSFDDSSLELRILPKVNQALISGFVYFYCPSDKKKDFLYAIEPNGTALYKFPRPSDKISYLLKVQLQDKTTTYYKEFKI